MVHQTPVCCVTLYSRNQQHHSHQSSLYRLPSLKMWQICRVLWYPEVMQAAMREKLPGAPL